MSEITSAVARLKDWSEEVVRGTLLDISSAVIMATPVDSGRLAGNWIPTFNSPASGEISTFTDQAGTINEVSGTLGRMEIGSTFYLTNNMPYAYRVEFEGWSHTKAPAGMLRVAFNTAVAGLE